MKQSNAALLFGADLAPVSIIGTCPAVGSAANVPGRGNFY